MTPAQEVLTDAQKAYDIATTAWYRERDAGGIVKLDPNVQADSDEIHRGARYKTTTPAGAMVLGVWQKCKAELDAAAANRKGELALRPDSRLPPERDEDAEAAQ